ncbi:Conserved_hypothetical protein [Hexamita inflata]|uniref:Uncharacterized protein n=1 Tax=Hexamita inflata TaxID=28002 RepID=A0ABP1GNF4_9EUKA
MPKNLGTNPNVYLEAERKKEFDKYYQEKIVNAKGQTYSEPPKILVHMQDRGLQRFEERQRQIQIDKDNAILLKRIEYQYTEAKGLDTHLIQKGPRSLNRTKREEELKKITEENKRLHKAILSAKPMMSNAKMAQQYKSHKYYSLLKQRDPNVFLNPDREAQLKAFDQEEIQDLEERQKQQVLNDIGTMQIVERVPEEPEIVDNDLVIAEMQETAGIEEDDGFTGAQVYVTQKE